MEQSRKEKQKLKEQRQKEQNQNIGRLKMRNTVERGRVRERGRCREWEREIVRL